MAAVQIARWATGGFFATALLTGVWKYAHIRRAAAEEGTAARAPVYVDTAHRAAFMYAFSCMLVERFAELRDLSHEKFKKISAFSDHLPLVRHSAEAILTRKKREWIHFGFC